MATVRTPQQLAEALTEYWSPRVIGEVDEHYVKVAKVLGTLTWHSHEHEDEMFFVLKGCFKIEMETETVVLEAGDMYVVAKGVRHNPIAEQECLLMLFERKSTLHTGTDVGDRTRSIGEQLRPV